MAATETGLGNQPVLSKVINQLRESNVGAFISLPQITVVGDQSCGKSSVLESLTGFAFPRAPGLCTRYATQITCSRESQKSVTVSIIPRPDADEALKTRLLGFHRHLTKIDNKDLAKIFKEANDTMGLRMAATDDTPSVSAFSQDILKVEIKGPKQGHLTVIDVPGIFRVPTPGLTTESDVLMVRNMVQSYMDNSRTIILAVIPCNVDIATQEILKMAETADPNGNRTMGVLTKPDLAMEKATQDEVIDLVAGKRNQLALGYFVVKNRGADDKTSTLSDRLAAEKAFFTGSPWSSVADRCGTEALQDRLRDLLAEISKREFPHVKAEVDRRLRQRRSELEAMGPSRADESSQRLHLGKIASKFQAITQNALNGYYIGNELFKSEPTFKLATRMIELNEVLSNVFLMRGHKRHPGPAEGNDTKSNVEDANQDLSFDVPLTQYPELEDIIFTDEYECPVPLDSPIIDHVREVFESSRGPEVGTFGGSILATAFEEQSENWEPLIHQHTSRAIALVHDYISQLLAKLCPDNHVKNQLWNMMLDDLCNAYRRAMAHADFLLKIERRGRITTVNKHFSANLQESRGQRMVQSLEPITHRFAHSEGRYVPFEKIGQHIEGKDNTQQVCEDIVDALASYYTVSRERFVDAVCQQVVNHFLLDGDESPLSILSPEFIMRLDADQLEAIAGEDAASKRRRQALAREVGSLEAATKVLRGST
ncbi:interferon-induced GTP-binding protein Mx2 [Hypomontagnella monticulosa]|nr:interferon-induced GTP-binding protein Mx2 [Hypomontagnella monticulosa]